MAYVEILTSNTQAAVEAAIDGSYHTTIEFNHNDRRGRAMRASVANLRLEEAVGLWLTMDGEEGADLFNWYFDFYIQYIEEYAKKGTAVSKLSAIISN